MAKFNAWRGVAALLVGFILGCLSGAWFQAHYLDKPDIVATTTIEKQTVKGRDNTATINAEVKATLPSDPQAESKKTRRLFKRNKK